jgi:hypothetical protein
MHSRTSPAPGPARSAAVAIGGGSLLTVALMLHHPSIGSSDLPGTIAEMSRESALSGAVHGALVAVMAVLLYGFLGFSGVLGWRLGRVQAAMICYILGILFLMAAAIVSGFVAPGLAEHFAGAPAARIQTVGPALRLCWEANQVLAAAGTVFASAAIVAWSLVLFARDAAARVIGAAGILVGIVPAAGLLLGRLTLDVHGMGSVLLAQAAWNSAVAWWLFRT